MSDRFSVLFVCRGNTKRSRGAEVIAAAKAERMGMDLDVSSAGLVAPTEGYELFNSQRLQKVLKRRGYEAGYHRRQQVTREMMEGKDLVLAMNNSHIKGIYDIAPDLMDKDTPIVDTLPAFVGYPHRRIVDPEERIDEVWKSEKWKWMRWMPYAFRRWYYRQYSGGAVDRRDEKAVMDLYDGIVRDIEGYVGLLLEKVRRDFL